MEGAVSNYYLCDCCDHNLRDCSACSCVCRVAGEEVVKAVVSDGERALDGCLWLRPRAGRVAAAHGHVEDSEGR